MAPQRCRLSEARTQSSRESDTEQCLATHRPNDRCSSRSGGRGAVVPHPASAIALKKCLPTSDVGGMSTVRLGRKRRLERGTTLGLSSRRSARASAVLSELEV